MFSSSSLPSALLQTILQRARIPSHLFLPHCTPLPTSRRLSTFYTQPTSKRRITAPSSSPRPSPPRTSSRYPPLLSQPRGDEPPSQTAIQPFAHLPRPPPLLDLLNSALSQSLKHRISPSLRLPKPHSHSSTPIIRDPYRIKALAVAQLTALHSALTSPLSQCHRAFPILSHLSGFDRAVMSLSLEGGEGEYVTIVRGLKRLISGLNAVYSEAVTQVEGSHIKPRVPAPNAPLLLTAALTSPTPPTLPASRDMDSLLSYNLQSILHKAASASPLYLDLLGLINRLSHLPVVRVDGAGLTVLVMGVPNVGKSSLLRAISSGKPEVQNYAFTTRGLVVGHLLLPEEEEGMEALEGGDQPVPPAAPRERRGSQDSGRRSRFATLNADEDTRAVLLHERRTAAASQAADEEQRARVKASYQSSLSASSPSVSVQLIDTPGLLFRPDAQRKSMELLTLTSLHHLPLQLVLFVIDDSGSCGWDLREQESVRREVRTRYQKQLEEGRVGWIDVKSKSDITEKYDTKGEVMDGEEGEERLVEEKNRKEELDLHQQLYGVQEGEGSAHESTCKVSVSIHDPQSLSRLQKEIRQQLRAQMRRMKEEKGEVYENIEDEFRRTSASHPPNSNVTHSDVQHSYHDHAVQRQ